MSGREIRVASKHPVPSIPPVRVIHQVGVDVPAVVVPVDVHGTETTHQLKHAKYHL